MAPTSPTVARWELALRLKRRREELGLTVKEITGALGFTRNYWSQVENEKAVLAEDKLDALVELFQFDPTTTAELHQLRDLARQRGWWTTYGELVDEEMQRFIGLEQGAVSIRTFESLMVPGLLQTSDYARAYLELDPSIRPVDIERLIEIRALRAERMGEVQPLHLDVVLSEAVLHQHVGTVDIHREQLVHLVERASAQPTEISLRVIPFDRPIGPLANSSTLMLMSFASESLGTVLWQEAMQPLLTADDFGQIRRAELSFSRAHAASLTTDDSLALLKAQVERA